MPSEKTLVQGNPTLDKMSARLGLAGAGVLGPILKGLAATVSITTQKDEILDTVRVYDDHLFDSSLTGTLENVGDGVTQWTKDIVFGTDTSYGLSGANAVRNYLEWDVRKKTIPNPSDEPSSYAVDRAYFDDTRNYTEETGVSASDATVREMSGLTFREEKKWVYIVDDSGWLKIVDKDGTQVGSNIELPASLGFSDPEAVVYMGSDRFAVLDEGSYGVRNPRIFLFHLTEDQTEISASDLKIYELDQVEEFPAGLGAEGIAYDRANKLFYVGTQDTTDATGGLWEVDLFNRDTDDKPLQTLLFRWYDVLVEPGHLGAGALLGDLWFSSDIANGQANNSIFCSFRSPIASDPATQRKVIQVAMAGTDGGTYISEYGHGITGKVEGFTMDPYTEEMWFAQEGTGTNFWRHGHTGYEETTTFKRQFWVKDAPAWGAMFLAGQEAQVGIAIAFVNPSDANTRAKDVTLGINILPTFADEFFTQHEFDGNRYAQTLRGWGGASTVEIYLDNTVGSPVIPEMDIGDLEGYYWTAPSAGLHAIIARLRADEGSEYYVDITGYIRFRQIQCPT